MRKEEQHLSQNKHTALFSGKRLRLFEIIEPAQNGDRLSFAYDIFMVVAIILGLLPLAFKERPHYFAVTDIVVSVIFVVDYLLRLFTADIKLQKKSLLAFIRYPFTISAIIAISLINLQI